jgi:hypothetical protein
LKSLAAAEPRDKNILPNYYPISNNILDWPKMILVSYYGFMVKVKVKLTLEQATQA